MIRRFICFVLAPVVLALAFATFAEGTLQAQTTTYNIVAPYNGGAVGSPYRVFNLNLAGSGGEAAQIPWLEVGQGTACANQTTSALGFVFLTTPAPAISDLCAAVTSGGVGSVTFSGTDNNGTQFTGSFLWTQTTACHLVGGRGAHMACFNTVNSGTLTITE